MIFETSILPEEWPWGDINSMFKNKEDQFDPKHVRPITIISSFGKFFTSVLNNKLNKYSKEYYIVCENQRSFWKGYSTITNLFILYSLVKTIKKQTFFVLLTISLKFFIPF